MAGCPLPPPRSEKHREGRQVSGRDAIARKYMFKDFNEAFSFMTQSALLAEKVGAAWVRRP